MAVSSRQELIDYCLRALGEPVVEVNVDDEQLEDRVDEALEYWRLYHWDGIDKQYMKFQIAASEIHLTTTNADQFYLGELVTGQTSGATVVVADENIRHSTGTLLLVKQLTGVFLPGETVVADKSGLTSTLDATTPYVLGSYDKHYIDVPDYVYGVTRVIPFNNASSSKNIFDLQYQLRLNDLYDLTSTSLIYYKTVMSHLALLDLELNGKPLYRFNRMNGKLYVDMAWGQDVAVGNFVMVVCYRALDPTTATKVYNEPWLKHYATALIKKQWGMNGKKFQGMVLPGGVTMDFQGLYDEAVKEMADLEDELMNKAAPLEFMLG